MQTVKLQIRGKINLSLNILDRKDGMHLIDSVMQSVSFGDVLTVCRRSVDHVNITFRGRGSGVRGQEKSDINTNSDNENSPLEWFPTKTPCSGAEWLNLGDKNSPPSEGCPTKAFLIRGGVVIDKHNNTVQKTVDYLKTIFPDFGADITIQKQIPIAGGLGGSSADAAGTLIALDRLFNLEKRGLDLNKAAAAIGSDVSFMMRGGCARVGGIGEKITPIANNLPLFMVVAHANAQVSSRDAYARFDTLYPTLSRSPVDNDELVNLLNKGDINALKHFANALEPASEALCGGILNVKAALLNAGALTATMTGSGGCVVGFFENQAKADVAAEKLKQQNLWAISCYSTNSGVSFL
ncbi:MAG: hypothetical protein FWE84_02455 [Firmicutes bacterium]|nr:hypothetical protein [Bacillota bacterium]